MDIFEQEKADSIHLLKLLYQKRWTLVIAVVTSCVLMAIFTSFIPPKYYSVGIIFPANTHNSDNVLINPQFGYDVHADQLMQLMESESIMDSIIQKYNLIEYYEIDTTEIDWEQKLDLKFINDVTIERTKYMSVVVSATTKIPQLSADIVNSMIDEVDEFRRTIFDENRNAAFENAKLEYETQQARHDQIIERFYALKDTSKGTNIIYNHLRGQKKFKVNPKDPFISSPEMEQLIYDYEFEFQRLNEKKAAFVKAEYMMNKPFPKSYKVDRARPSFKKYSPSYSLNLSIAFLGSLILTLAVILLNDKIKAIKKDF